MIYSMLGGCSYLAILDTMYGEGGEADSWFPISPYNHSGKRLYTLTNSKFPRVWVTNACKEQTTHSKLHGKPDKHWLLSNLLKLPEELKVAPLLVCGGVAQRTYRYSKYLHLGPSFFLPHPAARNWTLGKIENAKELVKKMKHHRGSYDLRNYV